jgi:hypothetical protein
MIGAAAAIGGWFICDMANLFIDDDGGGGDCWWDRRSEQCGFARKQSNVRILMTTT